MIVTYVPDPSKANGAPVVAEVVAQGTTVVEFSGVQPVFVTGGTIQTTIGFSGSISTDIGNVKIEDADENYAVMPPASTAKTGATKALVVQHVDETGTPLREATQASMLAAALTANSTSSLVLNTQGTLASSALQATGNSLLTAILNAQGTQSTAGLTTVANNQGTQATSALQAAGNATATTALNEMGTLATSTLQTVNNSALAAILNNQGTQASSALQTTGNSLLIAILNNEGTLATSVLQTTGNSLLTAIMNGQGTLATSALQTSSNALATVTMNGQGTLATSTNQNATNNLLTVIMNAQGTQADSTTEPAILSAILNGQGTQATSANQVTQVGALNRIANQQGTVSKTALYSPVGNPVDVATDSNGEYHLGVTAIQSVYPSSKNSTAVALTAGAVFYGTTETTLGVAGIQVLLRSDQNLTVYVDQSGNSGTNWDVTDAYDYLTALGGAAWTTQSVGDTFRVRAQNITGTNASYCRLNTSLCPIIEAVPRALSANGNFKVSVNELLGTFGEQVKSNPVGEMRVATSTRLVGALFSGSVLDANFWGSTAVGTGSITQGGNQVTLATGTTLNSAGTLISTRTARYVSGHPNYYRANVRCPTVVGSNTRRWGAYTATDGYFFEVQNTGFSVVTRKTGIDTKVRSGSFNGLGGSTYDLDTICHTYEIHWTNKSTYFVIDDVIVHKASGLTAPLTDTSHLSVSSECWNSSGNNSNNTLEIRVSSISRVGEFLSQNVLKNISQPSTSIFKYGPGNLHKVMICTAGTAGVTLAVYDSTFPVASASWGTLNAGVGSSANISGQGNFAYDYSGAPFYTGLCAVLSGPASINVIYE